MKRMKLKYLRAVLFLLLAILFAGIAVIEALPKNQTGVYIQSEAFTFSSEKQGDGSYRHTVHGSIQNTSSKKQYLDGVVVRVKDQYGEILPIEIAVGDLAPGEVREISGSAVSDQPASKLLGVNTSAISGDQPILLPATGLQMTKEFIIFAALSAACLGVALFFFIYRLTHKHHHHHSKKATA